MREKPSTDLDVGTTWSSSVVSAALTFHFGAFLLFLIKIPGFDRWSSVPENLFLDSMQTIAFVGLGAVCRILSSSVLRSSTSASRVVVGDLVVVVLAIAALAAIGIPSDSSGAVFLGIMVLLIVGVPVTAALSGLSILVEQYRWLQIVVTVTLIVNAGLVVVGLGLKFAG